MAMATLLVPVFFFFESNITIYDFIGRSKWSHSTHTLCAHCARYHNDPNPMTFDVWNRSKPGIAISTWRRTGTKSVAMATSQYAPCGVFLGYRMILCFTPILICIIQNREYLWNGEKISEKGKHHFYSFWKTFYMRLSCFSFQRHLNNKKLMNFQQIVCL